jgi:hypothetical protein
VILVALGLSSHVHKKFCSTAFLLAMQQLIPVIHASLSIPSEHIAAWKMRLFDFLLIVETLSCPSSLRSVAAASPQFPSCSLAQVSSAVLPTSPYSITLLIKRAP